MNIQSTYFPSKNETNSFTAPALFHVEPGQPLSKGDQAPAFSLPANFGKWTGSLAELASVTKITSNELVSSRPLVISFYSPQWNDYGHQHIQALVQLYTGVKALGGEMLVLTPEPLAQIYRLANHYQIPFSIAHDADNLIAYLFGVYDTQNPVWHRIAGITADVPAPATFVIAGNGQITAAFIDSDFQDALPARPVLSAVYATRDKRIKKVA
ncbi:redoxin domain-containing protein [Rhodocytophaga aerolata]|uniref:Redoxin domain-containing protein n=1 Tax=Rhodocytophaga aerolata TaxID=455078 RepID=A0ABT8R4R6_9BACT|nr:redoxin domain-containing protein [Rhodocytophaga aerolata]MDO1446929.1 redoxin domain-containing protein [Rhodocytophaga aerolata]